MNFARWLSLSDAEREAEKRNWRPFEPGYWQSLAVEAASRFNAEFGSKRHVTGVFKSLYHARELIVAVQTNLKKGKNVKLPASYLGFKVMQFASQKPEGVLVEAGPLSKTPRGTKSASGKSRPRVTSPRTPGPEPGSHRTLSLEGEIDLNASALASTELRALIKDKPEKLVIDLTNVSYFDSSALAVLMDAMRKVEAYRGKLYLVGMQESVRIIFETSRLDQAFRIRGSVDEALRS